MTERKRHEKKKTEKIPPLKTKTGQNVAFLASPTARNIAFLISPVLVRSTSFSPLIFFTHKVTRFTNGGSDFCKSFFNELIIHYQYQQQNRDNKNFKKLTNNNKTTKKDCKYIHQHSSIAHPTTYNMIACTQFCFSLRYDPCG